MQSFSLTHLDDTQFEQYCFDLIIELGFVNVHWRKGTGLSTSPSDRGRDIECERLIEDADGSKHFEIWFVECKHHLKGVPPEKLQSALSWANAKRPHVLLIIASNFLSNPASDYIKDYVENNRPHFRIKIWERKELEQLSVGKVLLLRKYAIDTDFLYLSSMNPAHILYLRYQAYNTLEYFLKTLVELEEERRNKILGIVYYDITGERHKNQPISFDNFAHRCTYLSRFMNPDFLVSSLVNHILQYLLSRIDKEKIEQNIKYLEQQIEQLNGITYATESQMEKFTKVFQDTEWFGGFVNPRPYANNLIDNYINSIKTIREDVEAEQNLYNDFCANIVEKLLKEDALS